MDNEFEYQDTAQPEEEHNGVEPAQTMPHIEPSS